MCWEQQMKQYPNAKVVLTIREFESWYKSCCDTIFKMIYNSPYAPLGVRVALGLGLPHADFTKMADKLLFPSWGATWHKEEIRKAFHAYNDKVKATVPASNLLVFEAKDGWEPLCSFLGVPVPAVPYPRANDTEEFQSHVNGVGRAGIVLGVLGLGIPFLTMAPLHPSALEVLEQEQATAAGGGGGGGGGSGGGASGGGGGESGEGRGAAHAKHHEHDEKKEGPKK